MGGSASCYRLEFGGLDCPGEMFGTNAPASTWHMTFDHANLGPVTYFVPVPADSPFNSMGNGQVVVQPKKPGKGGKGGKAAAAAGGGGGGGGNGGGGNGGGGNGFPAVMARPPEASRAASGLADDRPGRRTVGPRPA